MSMTALQGAVVARLKSVLSLTDANVGFSYDGTPPAFSGEEYLQVHPGTERNQGDESLDEYYDICVTLTRRTGYAPHDRIGSDTLASPTVGLYKRADDIKTALHKKWEVLDLAGGTCTESGTTWTGGQTYSIPDDQNGFCETLVFAEYAKPEPKYGQWFWATPEGDMMDPPSGISIEIRFKNARRVQTLESME